MASQSRAVQQGNAPKADAEGTAPVTLARRGGQRPSALLQDRYWPGLQITPCFLVGCMPPGGNVTQGTCLAGLPKLVCGLEIEIKAADSGASAAGIPRLIPPGSRACRRLMSVTQRGEEMEGVYPSQRRIHMGPCKRDGLIAPDDSFLASQSPHARAKKRPPGVTACERQPW